MTQEEKQQKAYEVYPLDLDRHMIIEGEPYDNNKEKREAYIRGLTDSKPSLPSDLDEAAEEAMRRAYPGDAYYYVGRPARRLFKEGFKAGAEWMAGQGVILNISIDELSCGAYNACVEQGLTSEDDVIVQIRKK